MCVLSATVCIVSNGELLAFAQQNTWVDLKREQANFLLDYFVRVTIDTPAILEAYAQIDTYSRRYGVRMGKNDLWIAATASVDKLVLVTTDRDFDHLQSVFLSRLYINPTI